MEGNLLGGVLEGKDLTYCRNYEETHVKKRSTSFFHNSYNKHSNPVKLDQQLNPNNWTLRSK